MISIDARFENLERFIDSLRRIPEGVARAGVEALNEVGDATTREVVNDLSVDTGFSTSMCEQFVRTARASHGNPKYEIEIDEDLVQEALGSGAPLERDFPDREGEVFEQNILVTVVTARDDKVCAICQRIAAEGPYTSSEIRALRDEHPHFLTRELRCRCALSPAQFTRRLPVRMRENRGPVVDAELTLRKLADLVMDKTHVVLRGR